LTKKGGKRIEVARLRKERTKKTKETLQGFH